MSKGSKKAKQIEFDLAAQKRVRNLALIKCLIAVVIVVVVTLGKQMLVMFGYISSENTMADTFLFVFTLGVCFFLVPYTSQFFAANRKIRELKDEAQKQ